MVAVGIDLGTTFSCVAVWRDGSVEVIANEQGNRTTPSLVAFTPTGRLIGESARNQAALNPCNTIFGAKRLIGRRFDDTGVQTDLHNWPYQVSNQNGKPMIVVDFRGTKKSFSPEEISSMILLKMKEIAENYLGAKVNKAVITVPAYFNDSQREATRVAASIAGLEVLRITNEPTAAALAYGLDRKGDKNVLIYDLGGGTLDVSVLSISGSVYEVKATAGNTSLGGEDFDNRVVAYFAEDFRKKYDIDILGNVRALRRMKIAAERAKRSLTSSAMTTAEVECVCDGLNYVGKITRAYFEEICSDLFRETLESVKKALADANLQKTDIQNIVLVGGSTRIPKIQRILREFFGGKELTTSVNPDEAVACGAAIQAAMLSGQRHTKINDLVLIDVVPASLGMEIGRGMMQIVVERNTSIPCQKTKEITTLEDYQTNMQIDIFEGERSLTKHNNLLGVIVLNGIPPAPRGVPKIDVTFTIDENGIVNVTAKVQSTGSTQSVTIRNENRLSHLQIAQMKLDAAIYQEYDNEDRQRLEVRNQLETYVFETKRNVAEHSDALTEQDKEFMKAEFETAMEWLDSNTDCMREDYEAQMTALMVRWVGVMKKMYGDPLIHIAKRQRSENYEEQLGVVIEEVHDSGES